MPTRKDKEKEKKEEEAKKGAPKKAEEPKKVAAEEPKEAVEEKKVEAKPVKVEKRRAPKKKKQEKGAHALYKIEGDKVTRVRPTCERCGIGYFMAEHPDRFTCGHCGFTRYKAR
jgi:small subunit ribosomal protein S27Ae